ncbi:MAG: TIGR02757 family protein [Planctomycetota bacterium]
MRATKKLLETVYRRCNRLKYLSPDPLELVLPFEDVHDREVAALIASALAYGRVGQIVKSVSAVLEKLGATPAKFLAGVSEKSLTRLCTGFKHRFADGEAVTSLLRGVQAVREVHGSMGEAFAKGVGEKDGTVIPALGALVCELRRLGADRAGHLLASPEKGGACKRLHLFLRWMVRKDSVDPGGWDFVQPSMLVVPLDTHMHRIGLYLGLTRRKSADSKTALEITDGFRRVSPRDPVRYDFALTRGGILMGKGPEDFLAQFKA